MAIPRFADDPVTERRLRDFAQTLSEKDRHRFAAIEALQRSFGGAVYVAGVLGCSPKTIERGIKHAGSIAGRVRRPGAGRKKRSPPIRAKKNT